MKKWNFTLPLLFSLFLFLCSTNTTQAQIQCCCSGAGCFNGNSGFDCDTWCPLVGLGTNSGSNTPYADPAACAADCSFAPVELTSFRAKAEEGKGVRLSWTTAAEIDNKGFNIQRMSGVDLNWETIGFEDGRGGTQETQEYSFYDETPPLGINYYRLEQVDYSGDSNFSSIESANQDPRAVFSVWPTVARDHVFLMVNEDYRNEDITVQVRDLMGQLLVEQTAQDRAIDIQSFSPGHYLISFYARGQMYTQQFIKAN